MDLRCQNFADVQIFLRDKIFSSKRLELYRKQFQFCWKHVEVHGNHLHGRMKLLAVYTKDSLAHFPQAHGHLEQAHIHLSRSHFHLDQAHIQLSRSHFHLDQAHCHLGQVHRQMIKPLVPSWRTLRQVDEVESCSTMENPDGHP